MKARNVQVWLLLGVRLLCQCNRLNLGGLLPVLATELGLDTQSRGRLLSAFPLGYMTTQVLGGAVSDRYGGKPVMMLALVSIGAGSVALSTLSDAMAMWTVMFLMGVLEGPSYPTNGVLLGRWVPSSERASATAIAEAGGPIGALVSLFVMPQLASSMGWRWAFGLSGGVTLAFAALWQALASNCPRECGYIKDSELEHLRSLGVAIEEDCTSRGSGPSASDGMGYFFRMLRLPSVWAVFLGQVCFNYNRYLMYNWVVTYYTDGLKIPVAEAGLCMFWPNVVDAVLSFAVGVIADGLARSGRMSTLAVRRLFSSLGFLGTGVGAFLLVWAEGRVMVTVLVTLASGMQACHNAGFKSTYGDLSVRYSGVLRGVGNMLGTGSSFVVPLLAASLLDRGGGSSVRAAWHSVFTSVFACGMFGTLGYVSLVATESIDERIADTGSAHAAGADIDKKGQ